MSGYWYASSSYVTHIFLQSCKITCVRSHSPSPFPISKRWTHLHWGHTSFKRGVRIMRAAFGIAHAGLLAKIMKNLNSYKAARGVASVA